MAKHGNPLLWIISTAGIGLSALAAGILFCFDPNSHGFYPICLFHRTTGLLCPGCGSLRALHQLMHGHLSAAFHFNPLLIVALPLVLYFGALYALRTLRHDPVRPSFSAKWVWLFVGIGLAFGVWRNLPGSPFAMLPH
jgi:hypothetical protein